LYLPERVKYLPIQELISELAVKALHVAVLPGRAGVNEQGLHAHAGQALPDGRGGKRRAVIGPHVRGRAMLDEEFTEPMEHAIRAQPPGHRGLTQL